MGVDLGYICRVSNISKHDRTRNADCAVGAYKNTLAYKVVLYNNRVCDQTRGLLYATKA